MGGFGLCFATTDERAALDGQRREAGGRARDHGCRPAGGHGGRPGPGGGRAQPGRGPAQDLGRGGAGRRRQDRDRGLRGRRLRRGLGRARGADDDPLVLGGRKFGSRLLVGTGKYRTLEEGREAIRRSGAEIVTVALRRVDLTPGKPNVLDTIDRKRHTILPNTAGCYTAEEAIRTCRLARELGIADLVKLEVIGDEQTLFPDGAATLEAARDPGEGGVHRPALLHGRSDPGPQAGGRRLRGGDAAGGADRLGARHPQSLQPPHHPRARQGADHRRRGRGHRLRRRRGDGARLRTAC